MRTPAEAAHFTREYSQLRGLEWAPASAFFAWLFFVHAFTSWPPTSTRVLWPVIPVVVVSVIIYRHLNRTYGVVRFFSAGQGIAIVMTALAAFLILQIISQAAFRIDVTGLFFGLMPLRAALNRPFRRHWHWLVPAAVAFLQLIVIPHQTQTRAISAWWGVYWTACTMARLWDHHLLVRSFDNGRAE